MRKLGDILRCGDAGLTHQTQEMHRNALRGKKGKSSEKLDGGLQPATFPRLQIQKQQE